MKVHLIYSMTVDHTAYGGDLEHSCSDKFQQKHNMYRHCNVMPAIHAAKLQMITELDC